MTKKLILCILCLLVITVPVYAETWEFAIAKQDEADLANGHKRKKEGDIIAVKPHPWQWGRKEREEYAIVIIDGLTEEEAEELVKPLYENPEGKKGQDGFIDYGAVLAKRRYQLDFKQIETAAKKADPGFKVKDFKDKKKAYQPLAEKGIKLKKENVVIHDRKKNK